MEANKSAVPMDNLTSAVGLGLVREIIPEEAPYFDEFAHSNKEKVSKDHTLGFGVSATFGLATAALVSVANAIVGFIWENSREEAGGLIKDAAEAVRRSFQDKIVTWANEGFKKPLQTNIPPAQISVMIVSLKSSSKEHGLNEKQALELAKIISDKIG